MNQLLPNSETIRLNNGNKMPVIGLGVYQIPKGEVTKQAVLSALRLGYRLIDTAALYGNEKDVGDAIIESGVPREEIFVTTKLHPLTLFQTEHAFHASLKKLQLTYLDLYLIHWPFLRTKDIWKILEKLYRQGFVKAIGVSNFMVKDLKNLSETANVVPAVNQVEFHPFLYQKKLSAYCEEKGIALQAHSPLTHGKRLSDPLLLEVSKKYLKSPAQILIRWVVQHGLGTVPKTTNEKRMQENINVFDFVISEEDMKRLDNLNEEYHAAFLSRLTGKSK